MSRTQIYLKVNGQSVYAGWSDEPIPSVLCAFNTENERLHATLAKVAAIVADPDAALVVDRVRAALEPTQPKGKP